MIRHKGFVGISILLCLSSFMLLLSALLFYFSRNVIMSERYGTGLKALYGAESGANWGLSFVREKGFIEKKTVFPVGDTDVTVEISHHGEEEWEIYSYGVDRETKAMRYVRLFVTLDENKKVIVRDVKSVYK